MTDEEGSLRIWWVPQVPGIPFRVSVASIHEGKKLLDVLANYDLFQLEQKIKSDYSNAGGYSYGDSPNGFGYMMIGYLNNLGFSEAFHKAIPWDLRK